VYREGFGGHFGVADFRQKHGALEAFLSETVVSTSWKQIFIRRVFEKKKKKKERKKEMFAFVSELMAYVRVWT